MIGDPIITLGLSPHRRTTLPASAFPEWAEVYLCDQCGRDVTIFFCRRQSHTLPPLAAERFQCACGHSYLTGAIEWDNLGDWERRRRRRNTIAEGVVLSVLSSLFAIPVYFLAKLWSWPVAATAASTMGVAPFLLVNVSFWLEVAASMRRTRRPWGGAGDGTSQSPPE